MTLTGKAAEAMANANARDPCRAHQTALNSCNARCASTCPCIAAMSAGVSPAWWTHTYTYTQTHKHTHQQSTSPARQHTPQHAPSCHPILRHAPLHLLTPCPSPSHLVLGGQVRAELMQRPQRVHTLLCRPKRFYMPTCRRVVGRGPASLVDTHKTL